MTALDVATRIARDTVAPGDASDLCAIVDVTAGGRLSNGYPSGLGVQTRYGVAWVLDGRVKSAPIAMFERQSDAFALIDVLRTGSTARSAPHFVASGPSTPRRPAEGGADPAAEPAEGIPPAAGRPDHGRREGGIAAGVETARAAGATPDVIAASDPVPAGSAGRRCKACGRSIDHLTSPTGQRRQTCDDSCRQAYHRGQRAPEAGVVASDSIERLSRLPVATAAAMASEREGSAQLAFEEAATA